MQTQNIPHDETIRLCILLHILNKETDFLIIYQFVTKAMLYGALTTEKKINITPPSPQPFYPESWWAWEEWNVLLSKLHFKPEGNKYYR